MGSGRGPWAPHLLRWVALGATICAGVLLAAAAAAVPAVAQAAPGVSELQSGYWWQPEPNGSPIPPPPYVPAHGLWVSSNATGTQSISAVRFSLPAQRPPAGLTLTLKVHQSQPPTGASIEACRTTSAWIPPPGPGAWSTRPVAACSTGRDIGRLSSDGTTLTFDLTSLAQGSKLDVVLVPALAGGSGGPALPGSPPASSPTFDVTFEPVVANEVGGGLGQGTSTGAGSPAAPSGGKAGTSPPGQSSGPSRSGPGSSSPAGTGSSSPAGPGSGSGTGPGGPASSSSSRPSSNSGMLTGGSAPTLASGLGGGGVGPAGGGDLAATGSGSSLAVPGQSGALAPALPSAGTGAELPGVPGAGPSGAASAGVGAQAGGAVGAGSQSPSGPVALGPSLTSAAGRAPAGLSFKARVLLIFVLLDLMGFGIYESRRRDLGQGRPSLTLYDSPQAVLARVAARPGSRPGAREGQAPPVR